MTRKKPESGQGVYNCFSATFEHQPTTTDLNGYMVWEGEIRSQAHEDYIRATKIFAHVASETADIIPGCLSNTATLETARAFDKAVINFDTALRSWYAAREVFEENRFKLSEVTPFGQLKSRLF